MRKARLVQDKHEVRLEHPEGRDRLVALEYPRDEESEYLFSQFSAMHLVAPRMPREIVSEFAIEEPMRNLIGDMYESEDNPRPKIIAPNGHVSVRGNTSRGRAVVSYSAGKDSMWNLWWAQQEYGKENVLAVHIRGLNTSNSSEEAKFSERQSREIGFPLETMHLKNSSDGEGYSVMISRDFFMTGILVPYALRFGAYNIITEGFAEEAPSEPFTGVERNMVKFNGTLEEMGLPVQVQWRNLPEMDIVKDLYQNVPDWMPHVCNCFSPDYAKPGIKRSWNGGHDKKGKEATARTPSFVMYDSQCGSCIKCQIVNVGRILYDPGFDATPEDVRTWIKNTDAWHRQHGESHKDMITPSYIRDLNVAADNYGVKLRYI